VQCFYFWEEFSFSKGHCLWHMASIKHWSQLSLFLGCYVSSIICLMNKAVGEISFHLKSFIVWMTVTFNKTNYHFFYLCYLLAFSWSEVSSCRVVVQTRLSICGSLLQQPVMSWHLGGHFLICLPDVLLDFFTLLGPDNLINVVVFSSVVASPTQKLDPLLYSFNDYEDSVYGNKWSHMLSLNCKF
jgi:hypothetical protein